MEQINRIELLGTVGSVRTQKVGDRLMAKFSVATNRAYKNRDGEPVIDTQWHNITAFEGRGVKDIGQIEKGTTVHLFGRLQTQRFTGSDGAERSITEVICNSLELIPDGENIQYEM
ncbi:MAG: single-stranded DNA-binding protein [Bacteroidales bacterium]|nr:single-stranded DNA-binding protein [Bacteroidales bacterium]